MSKSPVPITAEHLSWDGQLQLLREPQATQPLELPWTPMTSQFTSPAASSPMRLAINSSWVPVGPGHGASGPIVLMSQTILTVSLLLSEVNRENAYFLLSKRFNTMIVMKNHNYILYKPNTK